MSAMIRYLVDAANAITTFGVLCSALALYFALAGHPELAVAIALWAMLADQLDGVVAARTPNRSADLARMGKSLDGFADLLYGAVVPAVVVIALSAASALSLLTATLLLLAGALRLSYFNNFGLSDDGCFMGVPLSYDVPLLAILLLLRPSLPPESFALIVNAAFVVLAILHVASIRVPTAGAVMYAVLTAFSLAASAILVTRGLA